MQTLTTWTDTLNLIREYQSSGVDLFVRYSRGPQVDGRNGRSHDHVSGAPHAGLSANNLFSDMDREDGPSDNRLALRISEYDNLLVSGLDGTICWICTGDVVGRDSDGAPCLANVEPVAKIANHVIEDEIRAIRREHSAYMDCYKKAQRNLAEMRKLRESGEIDRWQ